MSTFTSYAAGIITKILQDNGTEVPRRKTTNFVGFTITDDPVNGVTTITAASGAGETNTMSNVGTGTGQFYKQKTGVDFEIKRLAKATGDLINIANGTSDVTLSIPNIQLGTGDPNGVESGSVGDLFMQTDSTGGLWQNTDGGTTWASRGGSAAFLSLTDTPSSYAGTGTYLLRVNAGATAVEFIENVYVTGPGSATDNAVARYDLTTGKLIQNSGVTIDDSNVIATPGGLSLTERADHALTPSAGAGQFWVKNDTPNRPYFTDDAGNDFDLTSGVSVNSESSVNITTDTNNLDPGTATTLLVTLTNNWNLTGIAAPGDGDSYRLVVINDDTQDILVLKHQDGSSLAANRFNLSNSVDIYLKPGDRATLTYNTTSGYWEQESLASLALRMVEVSPAALAAQQNNWDPSSGAYYNTVRVLLTGAQTLTGLVSPATSTGTREEVLICNIDATDVLTIAHQSTASTSANRIICPRGVSFQVQPGGSVLARYIIAANRWQLVAPDSAATLPYRFPQLEADVAASTTYDFDFDMSSSGPWGGPHEDDATIKVIFHVAHYADLEAVYCGSSQTHATFVYKSGTLYALSSTQEVPADFTTSVSAVVDNARLSLTISAYHGGRMGVFAEINQIIVNA